jgi:3-methyl-2-oxobutanoate hydroxymethyltransferase
MSVHKEYKKITAPVLKEMKANGEKIACLTAYDYSMAGLLDQSEIDLILIGDSLAMVVAGEESTIPATMDQMVYHSKIVAKAVKRAMVIADMPFMSYQIDKKEAIRNAGRFMQESGVNGVKIEGAGRNIELITELSEMGIPVMGHLGLTPQSIEKFGSYKLQAKNNEEAEKLIQDAKDLEKTGVFSIVLEKIPSDLAKKVSEAISVPTIGIGAGVDCDGQILVTNDMLGLFDAFKPKFVRRYNNLADQIRENLKSYSNDVKSNSFPNESESF